MGRLAAKTRPDLTVVEIEGEALVYDDVGGALHHLNPAATMVFGLCDGTRSATRITAEIAEACGADAREVARHVRTVIKQFGEAGLMSSPSLATKG
jgi:hypothetical protein